MTDRSVAWTAAFPSGDLAPGSARLFRSADLRVAVVRGKDGALYAVDDRCPHEGYPLSQGEIKECVLTCKWHNYKFDLRDGSCIIGEEAVRAFPVREVEGTVEVDLAPPDPESVRAAARASLDRGLLAMELGMVARDVVRLLLAGEPPEAIALRAAVHDARHAEYGSTHALPVAADVLRWLPSHPGARAAVPLVQAMDVASLPNARRPVRSRPEPADPGEDPDAAGARLRMLVEDEQAEAAEALFRGALARGWGPRHALPWLLALCADHFLDFGHALIYTIKANDLLAAAGWEHADDVLPSLLHMIVVGTREDTLPGWGGFNDRLAELEPRLAALFRQSDGTVGPSSALEQHLLHDKAPEAVDAVVGALGSGLALRPVIDALSAAAAERLLRFDVAHDLDPSSQDGWLDVTHMLTFVAAVRQASHLWRDPGVLRLVLQAARFVNSGKVLDRQPAALSPTLRAVKGEHPDLGRGPVAAADVLAAITAQDADRAIAVAARLLAAGPAEPLRGGLMDLAVADPAVRPIVVAHVLKTTVAAFDEHQVTGDPRPVLALVRFLASPRSERRVRRATEDALRLLVEGKVPRRLMP